MIERVRIAPYGTRLIWRVNMHVFQEQCYGVREELSGASSRFGAWRTPLPNTIAPINSLRFRRCASMASLGVIPADSCRRAAAKQGAAVHSHRGSS